MKPAWSTRWKIFRLPLLLATATVVLILYRPLGVNWVLAMNFLMPERVAFGSIGIMDYLVYLPNGTLLLSFLLFAYLWLEIRSRWLPASRRSGSDRVILLSLLLSVLCVMLLQNKKPGLLHRVVDFGCVMFLWLFVIVNANLRRWKALPEKPAVQRFLTLGFPVTDLFFYRFYENHLPKEAGPWKRLPGWCLGAVLAAAWLPNAWMWTWAIRAERLPAPAVSTCWAEYSQEGIWYTNSDWFDSKAGIWFYDERNRTSKPYVRVTDLRKFSTEDGFFYYHDRYDNHVYKVNIQTRKVAWRVPTQAGYGTFEVILGPDLVIAEGEGGYYLALTRDGRKISEEALPFRTWAPLVLGDGRVAYVSGDTQLRFWDPRTLQKESVSLPLSKGVWHFRYEQGEGKLRAATNWSDYDPRSGVYYVQTYWGEIFRWDSRNHQWLTPFKTDSGLRSIAVDSRNSLLFALNYLRGYLDVLDLQTGAHRGYILANALGRFINLDPVRKRGLLNTHGYGLYQFDYSSLLSNA